MKKELKLNKNKVKKIMILNDDSKLGRIGEGAFTGSGLKKITIPREVETLDDYCFYNCESLEEVIFCDDSKLRHIGKDAFAGSGVKGITIPRGVDTLGVL